MSLSSLHPFLGPHNWAPEDPRGLRLTESQAGGTGGKRQDLFPRARPAVPKLRPGVEQDQSPGVAC